MNINHILIVMTEPKSIFLEILLKYLISTHFKKNKKKISIVGNISYVKKELKKNFPKHHQLTKLIGMI